MLAEYGTMSFKGCAGARHAAGRRVSIEPRQRIVMERNKAMLKQWPYSKQFSSLIQVSNGKRRKQERSFTNRTSWRASKKWSMQNNRHSTGGKSRKEAIYAAYDRFYKGDIGKENMPGAARNRVV